MFEFSPKLLARIAARWPTPMDFYRERDDRTTRVVADIGSHVNRPVEIHVDPNAAEDLTVQRITLVAANLTARWARRLSVVVANDPPLVSILRRDGAITLSDRVSREIAMADPFGDFTVGPSPAGSAKEGPPLRLFIGPWRRTGHLVNGDDFQVYAAAWTALGRRASLTVHASTEPDLEATVAAAGLAGALGAADLFKRAIGHPRSCWISTFSWDTWLSHLSLGRDSWSLIADRDIPDKLDLSRTLLAGVGAIGSAFVYLADLMPLQGHVTLFDRDTIEITNLNRSPLFTILHALDEPAKTVAAAAFLTGRGLAADICDGLWREHAASLAQQYFDVWISLTNEDGAWAEVPFQLPPVVLHGTTTSGWGFGAGRHIPRIEDCTLCRMPRPLAEFRGPCAEGEIAPSVGGNEIRASLPFLSTASAALLLANFMQLNYPDHVTDLPNDISADLSIGLPTVVALTRGPSLECRGCRTVRSKAWIDRGGRSRFGKLSTVDVRRS